jgi:hypothetical protein
MMRADEPDELEARFFFLLPSRSTAAIMDAKLLKINLEFG